MGSTDNGNRIKTASQPSLFDSSGSAPDREEAELRLNAHPNVPLPSETVAHDGAPAAVPAYTEPVWTQRLKLVIFVLFCAELGMLLIVLPWTPVWTHNTLLSNHAQLRAILYHGFTRGAVAGLGLLDIWIGIWAAVQYREKK